MVVSMKKDEALKLALEALEGIHRYGLDTLSGRVYGPDDREWQRAGVNEMTKRAQLGINAIKEALAQPEQEPVAWISHNAGLYHFKPDESLDPLPLYLTPPPCPTCEALARTVMMDQTGRDA
jgi:hypothetical protein